MIALDEMGGDSKVHLDIFIAWFSLFVRFVISGV
jgi:hypothetical protein